MIQLLASKYRKHIAYTLSFIFYLSIIIPSYGMVSRAVAAPVYYTSINEYKRPALPAPFANKIPGKRNMANNAIANEIPGKINKNTAGNKKDGIDKVDIDGPSQPEMSSFKPAGTNDMVNLFTGDFNYNIPLLDVGGYPVNIFYDGGIGMEQEASWVGLGWNINPGNVNRNMRGVPDDFNGEETLKQELKTKPNITWGMRFGADFELGGIKDLVSFSGGGSLGVSFNNHLGPALEIGVKGGANFSVMKKALPEKTALDSSSLSIGVGVGVGANLNSRYGMTSSLNVSLTSSIFQNGNTTSYGVGLATSYNSRTGIKDLQLSSQRTFNSYSVRNFDKGELHTYSDGAQVSRVLSSTISFTKPTYIPAMRTINTNSAWSGHFQFGTGIFGAYGSVEAEVYKQKSEIADEDVKQEKPMLGYIYLNKGVNNRDAVMDFSRLNDKEVTPKTPIISAPQYAYDVFSIQGEGTNGTVRAYRNDISYMRDNYTGSKDKSFGAGVDIGYPGHFGGNFNTIKTPSIIGEWNRGNKLRSTNKFEENKEDKEKVYFRNPGESSVMNTDQYEKIGGTELVRYKLGGDKTSPSIEPLLERFDKENKLIDEVSVLNPVIGRNKRSQIVSFLTAAEGDTIGLDIKIKNYNPSAPLDINNKLAFTPINRFDGINRKENHISQINVTESDGKRYIYGIPVYNITQKEYTFTVAGNNPDLDQVSYDPNETNYNNSPHMSGQGKDGYVQVTTTPAYSHSFLLSGLLSPDYVDVQGDGITEDDLGTAVKFNYSQYDNHKWRTPLAGSHLANFNTGNRTEPKDDKGIIVYGERESWYLHSVESKTMIALFVVGNRRDGKGVSSELDDINSLDNSNKRLEQIKLYSKADLKKNGLAGAKPIKTVHFGYNYALCPGTPDNPNSIENGKLTLERIWFTYNGQNKTNKNQYVFSYLKGNVAQPEENPGYAINGSDRWGNYKPNDQNPGGLKNRDYPYTIQDKELANKYANAWALKKILLPSGGQIEVEYESDDYAFVQNKRAAAMSQIIGFSNSITNPVADLYTINGNGTISENDYVFIKVKTACANKTEVFERYLQGVNQLAFKIAVKMPNGGYEYIPSYASISDYGIYQEAPNPVIWVRLEKMAGFSPLSLTSVEFLREQLPGQAFSPGYDVSESSGLAQIGDALKGMLTGLNSAFKDLAKYFRDKGYAQQTDLSKCFVRINTPDGFKYGGGQRVKSIKLRDNWDRMTQQYGSVYGQGYDYTTKEAFNGSERSISSGVASYEPSIGGEENPFQTIVRVANELPLGPTSYGAIEMPLLDAFFPASLVGYSNVAVTSIGKKQNPDPATKKTRSGVGRQVTEFYTAKNYPLYYNYTSLDNTSDKQSHFSSTSLFSYKYAFDSRALSQGFIVSTNDMHGKMKSQSSYAENDLNTRINYTENFYRNTGSKGLNEKFDFAYNDLGAEVKQGNMGIDIELMTDTREFSVKSSSIEVQGQVDLFPIFFPFWLPFIWPVSGNSENTYRAVTTTKTVNYHAVLDSVVVIDKGSKVSTKNLVYDAETGQVIVNRTNNEFDKAIYSVNYPAYWAYSGMGLAYKNIDAVYAGVNFLDGKIVSNNVPSTIFESGDEFYIMDPGNSTGCDPVMASSSERGLVWALDKNKNNSSLTNSTPDFIFIDKEGKPYSRTGVKFRIVRSGHRNMLGASLAGVTMMSNPVVEIAANTRKLVVSNNSKVINASAIEFKEKWQTDNDVFKKYSTVTDPVTCEVTEVEDCTGYLEKKINPYRKGLLGNFRGYRNMVFYGERIEGLPIQPTNLLVNGYLKDFSLYWNFNNSSNLIPDVSPTSKWVWNSQSTRFNAKGMELETKDALNIYTAAQYGYSKTLPIAIANNSRSDEMMYEGFEDYDYNDLLNSSTYNNCSKRHLDFSSADIIKAEQVGFNAHSGKGLIKINNSLLEKNILIATSSNENFNLNYESDYSTQLNQPGGGYNSFILCGGLPCGYFPDYLTEHIDANNLVFNTNLGIFWNLGQTINHANLGGSLGWYRYSWPWGGDPCNPSYLTSPGSTLQYIEITTSGLYNFSIGQQDQFAFNTSAYNHQNYFREQLLIYNADASYLYGAFEGPGTVTKTPNTVTMSESVVNHSIYLCKGIYKIHFLIYQTRQNTDCLEGVTSYYNCSTPITSYSSLTTQNGCTYTKPIPASESMMNPTFTIPSNKKMVFSAWVRETNAQQTAYTNNEVQIDFGSGNINNVTIKPTGSIIEGWQRYEGYFTAPAGVSSMNLKLINNSGSPIYFDDIRIHPFNANMKSYVYDPVNLRLTSELDANNYASFYEYDEEGTLIRTKVETKQGIKTVTESRSAKQKNITDFQ